MLSMQKLNSNGIIILTYNNYFLVAELVYRIIQENIFNYIVIVDNCSTDKTWILLNKEFSGIDCVKLIKSDRNGGYAYGNNLGAKWLIKNTKVSVIFFANPDVIILKESVDRLIELFSNTDYALLAPVMKKKNGEVDEENYWDEPDYKSELLNCFYLYRLLNAKHKKKSINYDVEVMNVFAVTGSFFGIKKEIFKEIHGFDEGTFLFCEENILGKKLKSKGERTGIVTNVNYIHNHSTIIDSNIKTIHKYKIQLDSHYYFTRKYISNNLFKMMILRIAQIYSIVEQFVILIICRMINKIRGSKCQL